MIIANKLNCISLINEDFEKPYLSEDIDYLLSILDADQFPRIIHAFYFPSLVSGAF